MPDIGSKRRVVHFTTVHPPLDTRIFHKECRTLADNGYDVTLIAPDAPAGSRDGVQFVSLPLERNRALRLVLGNVRLLRLLAGKKADLYHFHDPELLPIGILLRLTGRRVIYDAHEHVRLSVASSTYLPRWVALPLSSSVRFLEILISKLGAHVLAATPTIAAQFGPGRCTVIGNFPDLEEFATAQQDTGDQNQSAGVYIGGINDERCLEQIFDALESARRRNPELHLIMAGPVDDVRHPSGIDGVDYRGVVDRPTVSHLMATSAFGLVLLRALPNCVDGLPTKFFEYAAAGTPMIISASTVNLARIAEQEHCGLVVDETSVEEIASAMLWMLDHPSEARAMGVRARQAVEERYHWGSEARRLLDTYRQRLDTSHNRLDNVQ